MTDLKTQISTLRDLNKRLSDEFGIAYISAVDDLLAQVLPDLSAEAVESAIELSGVEDLQTGAEAEVERVKYQREISEIESDPLYQMREQILCPDTGEVGSSLEQLKQHREALEPVLRICLENPRFVPLMESGFGTKAYGRPFWRMSYHTHRKAAKEIEERCKGKPWAQIRQDVLSAMEASSVLDQRIRSLQERAKNIDSLAKKRSQLLSRLQRFDQIWLSAARWRIRRLFEAQPDEACERLTKTESLREAALRWRTRLELKEEIQRLRTEFLQPAQVALDERDRARAFDLLEAYESRQGKLLEFARKVDKTPSINWERVFYG